MSWKRMAGVALLTAAAACAPQDGDVEDGMAADTLGVADTAAAGDGAGSASARAELRDTAGTVVGTATLADMGGGVHLELTVEGLTPGEHGVHIHAVGQCDPAGETPFSSAGGHFNPDSAQHGLENPQGPHAGDLPNMTVGADGRGTLTAMAEGFTIADGERTLFDADGAAIVVHADPDDMRSDPAGNAGSRVACGVIERS